MTIFIYFFFFFFFAEPLLENSHLASSLARSCRYSSVCQNYQSTPNNLSALAISLTDPGQTDRRTHIIGHSSKVSLSIGRIGRSSFLPIVQFDPTILTPPFYYIK